MIKHILLVPALALVCVGVIADSIIAQERPYGWGWEMHPMWWMGSAWGIGMLLIMLLFWILLIAAVLLGIRWIGQSRRPRPDSALEILRERYARGEINKEEFEVKKRDLNS